VTRLAFDMSSYLKTALLTGKDTKDGQEVVFEDKKVLVNSAEYGYEIIINMMIKTLHDCNVQPTDCLLVFEGLSSKSRRLLISSDYKGKRDKRPPEFYEEFIRLREYVEQVWKDLGAISMKQDYVEADDVLGWLARESEENIIIASRDSDLGVLNTEQGETNAYGATVTTYNDGRLGLVMLEPGELFVHPFKYIHLYKSLVGDSSDNIPGATGFGKAAFQKLCEKYEYDGLDQLIGLLEGGKLDDLHELADEMAGKKPAHPLIKKIVEHEADVVRSYKLAKIYPEWVNTMSRPVIITPGKIVEEPADRDERLQQWYGQSWLVDAANYDEMSEFFNSQLAASPDITFDLESSTPDESDDWVASIPRGKGAKGDMVDQLGSVLTGFSFTFGANRQYTVYVCVDHYKTNNVKMSQARNFIELAIASGKDIVIHNNFFELCVLGMAQDEDGEKWMDLWKDLGARGFLPNSLDTKFEASYVNENIKNGLKLRSKEHLGYEQVTFEQVTTLDGKCGEMQPGGKLKLEREEVDPATGEITVYQRRQYKMRELTGEQVFAYGCDDTICTVALHNYFKLVMQLEHTWQVCLNTEIKASYQHAKNFIDGIPFSLEKMRELEALDDATFDKAWATVRAYLMKHGWAGTVPPTYGADISAAQIKEAYRIVKGAEGDEDEEAEDISAETADEDDDESSDESGSAESEEQAIKDPFLSTRTRTPAKLVVLLRELGHETFAGMVEACIAGEHEKFTAWVRESFTGEPLFKSSNKQLCNLLYEVMGLPIRVRGKPTELMRKANKPGNPKADVLALEYALRDGDEEQKAVINGLKLMQMVKTRRGLYYSKYPYFMHWKTGRVHPSHNQCQTNTRRASMSAPNTQQLPKHPKIKGQDARFRECIVPHHPDAVIVSLDEDSQELRVIADYSQDANMVSAFVGENKKSLHSLTGHSIAVKKKMVEITMTYDEFDIAAKDKNHPLFLICSEYRTLGKKVNFTTEFGAMAPKLAMTMLVPEAEAQTYIDAKEAMFPGVRKWKNETIAEAKKVGYVRTKDGAMRHLAVFFNGSDHWLKSKAERQAVNFKVQSSSAEMIKKAEGRVWDKGLVYKYDAVCYGPVHDEIVFSVMKKDLVAFLEEAHACMVAPYGGMTIPIVSSISFGPDFGRQFEIGAEPTAKAVDYGWKQIDEKLGVAA
jgi:5'-3' exonuclease